MPSSLTSHLGSTDKRSRRQQHSATNSESWHLYSVLLIYCCWVTNSHPRAARQAAFWPVFTVQTGNINQFEMKLGIPPMESAWKCPWGIKQAAGKGGTSLFQMECEKELFWMLQSMHTLMHIQGRSRWIRIGANENNISMLVVGSWHLQTLPLASHWVKGCMYPSGVFEKKKAIKVKSFTQGGLGADREKERQRY